MLARRISPQVATPGTLLLPRSPALDDLRRLAAGCRACSTKGHVERALRARGVKTVDLRAAGVTVRLELEPASGDGFARDSGAPATGEGCVGTRRGSGSVSGGTGSARTREGADEAAVGPATTRRTYFKLSVGCCTYQKGKYLTRHVDGEPPAGARLYSSPLVHLSRPPPPPLPPPPRPPPFSPVARLSPPSRLPTSSRDPFGRSEDAVQDRNWRADPVASGDSETGRVSRQSTDELGGSPRGPAPGDGGSGVRPHAGDGAHWGGGKGPRPSKAALATIQSLRVPLSDPHYVRVSGLSLCLAKTGGGGGVEAAGGSFTEIIGGGDNAREGWNGELVLTRCAVLGNPGQPRVRADAVLSLVRVEVRRRRPSPSNFVGSDRTW